MLSQILNKVSPFHNLTSDSPTHHQLIRCMQAAGLRFSPRAWRSRFGEHNLNFAADACEYLEFKHYLARLVSHYCPEFMPETYIIDNCSWSMVISEIANKYYYQNAAEFQDCVPNLAWILKPALLNNGHHIKIFDRLSQIEEHFLNPCHVGGPHVLQRYISDPDLYEGHKYSLRFFVVITQEAGAFLYRQGYSNVALKAYAANDYTDLSLHLTNEHLSHDTVNVVQIPTTDQQVAALFPQITTIVRAVTNGLENAFPHAYQRSRDRTLAFFGFDFLVDSQNKVWILEANHGPCFPIDETHALHQSLYQPFWNAVFQQFIMPIIKKRAMNAQGGAAFIAMRS